MGRTARAAYELDDVAIVPSRRTRSSSDVSTAWQIDAYRFEIPLLTQPADAIVSPGVAAEVVPARRPRRARRRGAVGRATPTRSGGSTTWSRSAPTADDLDEVIREIQRLYAAQVSVDLLGRVDPRDAFRRRHGRGPAVPAERIGRWPSR